jgi:hypothetical protein
MIHLGTVRNKKRAATRPEKTRNYNLFILICPEITRAEG